MKIEEIQYDLENEIWIDIPGINGYSISNTGRVRSNGRIIMRKNGWPQTINQRILKQAYDEWGYPMVRLNCHCYKVHRLMALAFLGERKNGDYIRHLDGNPKNNRIENLAYGSPSQNQLDCYSYRGSIRNNQKLNLNDAQCIKEDLKNGVRSVQIAKQYGVSQQTICDIKHGRIYAHI